VDGRQTGSNSSHPLRGALAAILPLIPRRLQLTVPFGLNLLLMPGKHAFLLVFAQLSGRMNAFSISSRGRTLCCFSLKWNEGAFRK
jgi:hypothetical protein